MLWTTILLDRDLVANMNQGYFFKHGSFDFIDGILQIVRCAYQQQCKLVVMANQAGTGRGYCTEKDFHKLIVLLRERFASITASIDRVYFSPYQLKVRIGKYLRGDFLRRPHPGMPLQAKTDLNVDLAKSVLIGDKANDIKAGISICVNRNLLLAQKRLTELDGLTQQIITTLYGSLLYLRSGNVPKGVI